MITPLVAAIALGAGAFVAGNFRGEVDVFAILALGDAFALSGITGDCLQCILIIESGTAAGVGGFGVGIPPGTEMNITITGLTHLRILIRVLPGHVIRPPASIARRIFISRRRHNFGFLDVVFFSFVRHGILRRFLSTPIRVHTSVTRYNFIEF